MRPRSSLRPAVRALTLLAMAAAPSAASELRAAVASVAGIVVHDAAETLRDYCRGEDGRLFLVLPGGSRWELVTSTSDPAIANPGDGAFHAFEGAEVAAAVEQVRFPLGRVSAEVFILPYPRRLSPGSAAGQGLILLSPGVLPLSREHQHAELVHELGHVVQYALLPDADRAGWDRYGRLRGLDTARNTAAAPHADRPHEIWAEDFRALFGGSSANSTGTIENAALAYPTQVPGLGAFMESLAGAASVPAGGRLTASAVSRGTTSFSRRGGVVSVLDVYDAAGRRVASLEPRLGGAGVWWSWDGADRTGRRLRSAVVFARARDGVGGTVRVAVF